MMAKMLDLAALTGGEKTTMLSGKARGESAREGFALDAFDAQTDEISVRVPASVAAITPSFVLGMFGKSVLSCGTVDLFLEKYRFDVRPHLLEQIRRGADYSLMVGNPLSLL